MVTKGDPCEHSSCSGKNENCFYGKRLELNKDGYVEGCSIHDDFEIKDLEKTLQSMWNDCTVENAFDIYNERARRYKALTGNKFTPRD